VPAGKAAAFLHRFDGWARRNSDVGYVQCLNGTSVAFERVANGESTSGRGNCERHYDLLRQQALAFVKRHLPDAALALHPDWHEIEP
jgi:hypothetical protein